MGTRNRFSVPLHAGDVIAFYGSHEPSSWTIRLATGGPSHVGIVAPYERNGYDKGLALYESTTLVDRPCLEFRVRRSGVQVQDPWERLGDYDYRAVIYRLTPFWSLDEYEADQLAGLLLYSFVLPRDGYDMARAILSGTFVLRKWLKDWLAPDSSAFFCSELCAAALQRFNRLNHKNPWLYTPASLCRELRAQGKVTRIPVRDDYLPWGSGFWADVHARAVSWLN